MASPSSVASRTLSKSSASEEEAEFEQYGRTSSGLHAEAAAAALGPPSPSPSILSRSTSTPNLVPKQTAINSPPPAQPAPPNRRSSYMPTVSSLLNPTTPLEPRNGLAEDGRRLSDGSGSSSSNSQTRAMGAIETPRTLRGRPPPRRPVYLNPPSLPGAQHSPPASVRDLGADYTRYFNPFSDSKRGSFVDGTPSRPRSPASIPGPGSNPFSTPGASSTKLNIQDDPERTAGAAVPLLFMDDRLGAPYSEKAGYVYPSVDEPETDDDMHLPQPDDDITFKTPWKVHFNRENIVSTFGMFFMIIGMLFVFVALPVMSSLGVISYNSDQTPLDQMGYGKEQREEWAIVNNLTYSLLRNVRTGLIDPATPSRAKTRMSIDGEELELVFSDEFNDNNRTFYEGDDPYWYAPDIWYGATVDLDWYDPDAVTTWDGTLEMRLDKFINHGVGYRSGMLNSWNHLCFKGGVFEVSVSLPGPAGVMGLWPGAWTMGNLGRPGYLATTEGLWPYTYDSCDAGITPNQSSYDGLSRLPGQRLPSCTCPNEDHPTPGTGRGAPEIDILEAGASYAGMPIITQSYQVAPFDIWYYPDYEFNEYPDYSISYPNGYTGGPFQQALSATTNLNHDWYDGKAYQKYSFEYVPGEGEDAYIAWYVGDQMTWKLDGRAVGPNGNIQSRQVSQEPMSLVLNMGFSNAWTFIDFAKLVFPAVMRVDYVRWYQKSGNHSVTCDPPGWETTQYIKDHMNAYTNPNFTKWDQTGHAWPKHKLNSDC